MKRFLRRTVLSLLVLAGLAALVWRYAPEQLPHAWRQDNPHSRDYAPVIYRWTDDRGVVQLTDTPPTDRPYQQVRIDPDTNIVPSTLPRGGGG